MWTLPFLLNLVWLFFKIVKIILFQLHYVPSSECVQLGACLSTIPHSTLCIKVQRWIGEDASAASY